MIETKELEKGNGGELNYFTLGKREISEHLLRRRYPLWLMKAISNYRTHLGSFLGIQGVQ